jgi:uncharacterized membrane protein YhhN
MDAIGIVIVVIALVASIAIPLLLARKWGWPIAFIAVAIWMLVWIAGFKQGDLSWPDAIGASFLAALLWLIGAAFGQWLHGRGGNRTQEHLDESDTIRGVDGR